MVDRDKERQRVEAYRRELAQDPGSLAFVALAETLNRLAQWDDAADVATRGLLAHPSSVAGRLALAVAEAGRDHLREALDHIKVSLTHDPDNARALGLMGSLLLQRGLAQRAIPFLAQAVKLEPHEREYGDLLKRARKLSKSEQAVSLPAVRRDRPSGSPWTDEGAEPTDFASGEAEHTVFAADAASRARPGRGVTAAVDAEGFDGEAEPTRHLRPGESLAAPDHAREVFAENEVPATHEPPRMRIAEALAESDQKRPKVGGSAADYSRILRDLRAEGRGIVDAEALVEEDLTVDAVKLGPARPRPQPPPPPEPTSAVARAPRAEPEAPAPPPAPPGAPPAEASARADGPDPEPVRPRRERSSGNRERPSAPAPAPEAPPRAEAAPEPAPEAEPAAARPKREKPKKEPDPPPEDRPPTMMVDDAIWAMLGADKPGTVPPSDGAPPPPRPSEDRGAKKDVDIDPRRAAVRVVRTDRWAGVLTFWAIVLVASGGAAVASFGLSTQRGGKSVVEVSEELRGIAADLERGTLASLLAADEAIERGLGASPQLRSALMAARAEIDARLEHDFGGGEEARARAREALAELTAERPSLESLVAETRLATGTAALRHLAPHVEQVVAENPRSPKALTLRAFVDLGLDDPRGALGSLLAARALEPRRRETLLALAQLYAREGATDAALETLAALNEAEPSDVQAALERFLVHQVTGGDPDAGLATARLAGLVREESPEIAKDEVGRVALAFAVAALRDGDLEGARAQLALAESAFPRSLAFRRLVGRLLLALGEWDRALAQLDRALELSSAADVELVALQAAARLGQRRDAPAPPLGPGWRGKGDRPPPRVRLPFGSARFVFARFEPIEVSLDEEALSLSALRRAAAAAPALAPGGKDEAQLEAAVKLAHAERLRADGRLDDARTLVESALAEGKTAPRLAAAARLAAARGELAAAERQAEQALVLVPDDAGLRLLLAELRVSRNDLGGAKAALEPLTGRDVVAPDALLLLAEIRQRRGDPDGARELLERVTDLALASARQERRMAGLYHRLGDAGQARAALGRAVELEPGLGAEPRRGDARSGVELFYLARAALDAGDERRGQALLEAAVARADAPIEARFHLGKLLVKRPRTRKQGQRELARFVSSARPKGGRARGDAPGELEPLVAEATRLSKGR